MTSKPSHMVTKYRNFNLGSGYSNASKPWKAFRRKERKILVKLEDDERLLPTKFWHGHKLKEPR